jgi:hypothetical protein
MAQSKLSIDDVLSQPDLSYIPSAPGASIADVLQQPDMDVVRAAAGRPALSSPISKSQIHIPTIMGQLGLTPSQVEQDILNIGGGLKTGLATGVSNVADMPLIRDIPGSGGVSSAFGKLANARAPFADPNSIAYKVADTAGQYAPGVAGAEASIPEELLGGGLSRLGLATGAGTYAASPGGAEQRVAPALLAGASVPVLGGAAKLVKNIPAAGGLIKSGIKTVSQEIPAAAKYKVQQFFNKLPSAPEAPTEIPANLDNDTSQFWNNIFSGKDASTIKNDNANAVREIYRHHLGVNQQQYADLGNQLEQRGYPALLRKGMKNYPGISGVMDATSPKPILQTYKISPVGQNINPFVENGGSETEVTDSPNAKSIQVSPETNQIFGNLLGTSSLPDTMSPTKESLDKIKAISQYPSVQNALHLQSVLGKTASKFYGKNEQASANTAELLSKGQKSLLNDIYNTFRNNGDEDLANQLGTARDYYRDNIIPYRENKVLNNIVENNQSPSVSKVITGGPTSGQKALLNHLFTTPDEVAAPTGISATNQLKQGLMGEYIAPKTTGERGSKSLTLPNLNKGYNSAPDAIKDLAPQQIKNDLGIFNQRLGQIKSGQEQYEDLKKAYVDHGKRMDAIAKKYIYTGALGAGLGAVLGGHKIVHGTEDIVG